MLTRRTRSWPEIVMSVHPSTGDSVHGCPNCDAERPVPSCAPADAAGDGASSSTKRTGGRRGDPAKFLPCRATRSSADTVAGAVIGRRLSGRGRRSSTALVALKMIYFTAAMPLPPRWCAYLADGVRAVCPSFSTPAYCRLSTRSVNWPDCPTYSLEYVEGGTLAQRLGAGGPLPVAGGGPSRRGQLCTGNGLRPRPGGCIHRDP